MKIIYGPEAARGSHSVGFRAGFAGVLLPDGEARRLQKQLPVIKSQSFRQETAGDVFSHNYLGFIISRLSSLKSRLWHGKEKKCSHGVFCCSSSLPLYLGLKMLVHSLTEKQKIEQIYFWKGWRSHMPWNPTIYSWVSLNCIALFSLIFFKQIIYFKWHLKMCVAMGLQSRSKCVEFLKLEIEFTYA